MIFLFTDFGSNDIYLGQIKAALVGHAPSAQCIDLLHEAHPFDIGANAHLLAALAATCLPPHAVMLAVVDPGVGGPRQPIVMQADERWYVGPDNGLLSVVADRAQSSRAWRIVWQPQVLSHSFHGRDLFAPIAALLATEKLPQHWLEPVEGLQTSLDAADLPQIIYLDHYGNAMTGLRAKELTAQYGLGISGRVLRYARVFCEAPPGEAFWYENSLGLVEIAINGGSAAQRLGLAIGDKVRVVNR